MMDEDKRYGLLATEWEDAKAEIRHIVSGVARFGTKITYGELAAQLNTVAVSPRSGIFHAMLREICIEESEAGRGKLCALVVNKQTGLPGPGFFRWLAETGRNVSDIEAVWQSEANILYDYWAEH